MNKVQEHPKIVEGVCRYYDVKMIGRCNRCDSRGGFIVNKDDGIPEYTGYFSRCDMYEGEKK